MELDISHWQRCGILMLNYSKRLLKSSRPYVKKKNVFDYDAKIRAFSSLLESWTEIPGLGVFLTRWCQCLVCVCGQVVKSHRRHLVLLSWSIRLIAENVNYLFCF